MKQIYFGVAIHSHQPVGNFPWVFEQAYQQAYLPMLEAIERHPVLKFSLHYSGCLIDWLQQNHPDFLQKLANLVEKGQVEIMSGGYYEPILIAIPDADKLGQIVKMSTFINQQLGFKPTGLWLAERVWEPSLTEILAQAGIEWTLVDDTHFKWVGLEDKELFGYYITEEQGCFLKVFPISKYLRYSIPWRQVDEVITFFKDKASDQEVRIAVLGDDGEKFGVWPGTYKHCWEEKWIDNFFSALEDNQEWLHTIKLGDYLRKSPAIGRIYLPCAAYDEMLGWALPAQKSWEYSNLKRQLELEIEGRKDLLQFIRCGFWRHFLVKYPEANRMHKKMLLAHKKVHKAHRKSPENCGLEELWQAQCNEVYWHGVFGGVYLADLRATTYSHLIQAENKADKVLHRARSRLARVPPTPPGINWEKIDFDGDGFEEVLINSDTFSLYFSPKEGGSIFEWDLRNHSYNLLATLARRPEAYHQVLTEVSSSKQDIPEHKTAVSIHDQIKVKNADLSRLLVYDSYPRSSLVDHFLSQDAKLTHFADNSFTELGDFVNQPYQVSLESRSSILKICLTRKGSFQSGKNKLSLEVTKQIRLEPGIERLLVSYAIKNISDLPIVGVFGSEWNINLLGGGHNEAAYYQIPGVTLDDPHLDSWGELSAIDRVILGNHGLGIEIEVNMTPKVNLWRFPVETISNSEAGIEKLYQASCLVFLLPLNLPPDGSVPLKLDWIVKS